MQLCWQPCEKEISDCVLRLWQCPILLGFYDALIRNFRATNED